MHAYKIVTYMNVIGVYDDETKDDVILYSGDAKIEISPRLLIYSIICTYYKYDYSATNNRSCSILQPADSGQVLCKSCAFKSDEVN